MAYETDPDVAAFLTGGKSSPIERIPTKEPSIEQLRQVAKKKKLTDANPQLQPDLAGHDYILERQLKPEARKDIIEMFKALEIVPTAMIDVSDGLASEIFHLADQSKMGITIYEEKIPIDTQTIDPAVSFDLNPSIVALNGGEDYELLMTIPIEYFEQIKSHPDFTIIGHATEFPMTFKLNTRAGNAFDIQAQGWQHINKENK
jgi:thiamine-monophosphate kinase